ERRDCALAPPVGGSAPKKSRQMREPRTQMHAQKTPKSLTLSRQLGPERRQGAAVRAICAMLLGEIRAHQPPQGSGATVFFAATAKRADGRLGGKVVLACEMPVEAAMRKAGAFHDHVDSDAVKTVLAKQARGSIQDAFPVLRRSFSAHAHVYLPQQSWSNHGLTG